MHYTILIGATNPILRSTADPIDHFWEEIIWFARDMKRVCHEHDGVGLAAPQIGLPLRIIYITQRKKTPKWLKYVTDQIMINPEILMDSRTRNSDVEGCLSLPRLEGDVKRFDRIRVKFQDVYGKSITKTYKWFDARIIQHEIDHLDGILFIDKATNLRKI